MPKLQFFRVFINAFIHVHCLWRLIPIHKKCLWRLISFRKDIFAFLPNCSYSKYIRWKVVKIPKWSEGCIGIPLTFLVPINLNDFGIISLFKDSLTKTLSNLFLGWGGSGKFKLTKITNVNYVILSCTSFEETHPQSSWRQ